MSDYIEDEELEFEPMQLLGTTGLKRYGGLIDEEFNQRLKWRNGIKIYREMTKNSPTIATAYNAIRWLIRQVEWRIEPADESDAAKVEAEDTEFAFEDMSHTFDDLVDEALSMIWAGYSFFEIQYKIRRGLDQEDGSLRSKLNDGKFGWRRIDIRGQETIDRWLFDEDGGLNGVVQLDMYGEGARGPVVIPIEKALLFRISKFKGNPEGESLLRPAVVPYFFAKRIQEFEAIGIERNLAGMPVMEVPPEILTQTDDPAKKALRSNLEKFVTSVRKDERYGGLVPSEKNPDGTDTGFKFKLMQTSGKPMDTDPIIRRYRDDQLRVFMAQFLSLGQDGTGSFALSKNLSEMFGTALGVIMDSITDVINQFLIPRRQRLNGKGYELDPFMVHGDVSKADLEKVSAYISSLSSAGLVTPHPALERHLMELGGFPQPPEEEDLINPLSEAKVDQSRGRAIDPETVRMILDLNKAVSDKKISREAAVETLADHLGIESSVAEKYFSEEEEEGEIALAIPDNSTEEDEDGSEEIRPDEGGDQLRGSKDGEEDDSQDDGSDADDGKKV